MFTPNRRLLSSNARLVSE